MINKRGPKKASPIITDKLCEYGCGKQALFLNMSGKYMCSILSNYCQAVKDKNSASLKSLYDSGNKQSMADLYQNLPEDTKERMNWNKDNFTNTKFEYDGGGNHKRALILERGHRCEDCGLESWKSSKIPLELEHIDGNNRNNIKSNLKLLCCNCHAMTDTWRGRNSSNGKIKVSDDEMLLALKECSNIRQALLKVGLTPKGANYDRANKLKATLVK